MNPVETVNSVDNVRFEPNHDLKSLFENIRLLWKVVPRTWVSFLKAKSQQTFFSLSSDPLQQAHTMVYSDDQTDTLVTLNIIASSFSFLGALFIIGVYNASLSHYTSRFEIHRCISDAFVYSEFLCIQGIPEFRL